MADDLLENHYPRHMRLRSLIGIFFAGVFVMCGVVGFMVWRSRVEPSVIFQTIVGDTLPNPFSEKETPKNTDTPTVGESFTPAAGARMFEKGMYVTYVYYTRNGFIPQTIVITRSEKVRFVNATSLVMRVGTQPENLSSPYYASFNDAKPESQGGTYELVLSEPGVWAYENLAAGQDVKKGTVYVR